MWIESYWKCLIILPWSTFELISDFPVCPSHVVCPYSAVLYKRISFSLVCTLYIVPTQHVQFKFTPEQCRFTARVSCTMNPKWTNVIIMWDVANMHSKWHVYKRDKVVKSNCRIACILSPDAINRSRHQIKAYFLVKIYSEQQIMTH